MPATAAAAAADSAGALPRLPPVGLLVMLLLLLQLQINKELLPAVVLLPLLLLLHLLLLLLLPLLPPQVNKKLLVAAVCLGIEGDVRRLIGALEAGRQSSHSGKAVAFLSGPDMTAALVHAAICGFEEVVELLLQVGLHVLTMLQLQPHKLQPHQLQPHQLHVLLQLWLV